jgi:flagellar protein FliO/FliZ
MPANATFAGPRAAQPAAAQNASAAGAAVASASSLSQVALVLLLVVGLIAGTAWLLRRLGMARNTTGSTVRIVSGVSLSNRERILVVEVADQWIVVGVSPGGINTLTTMPRQEPVAGTNGDLPAPPGKQFAHWLKQTVERRNAASRSQNDD